MSHSRPHTRFGSAILITLFALAGCSQTPPSQNGEGEARIPGGKAPLRLALVASTGNRALNDGAIAGLHAANVKLGADVQVLRAKSAGEYQPNLTLLANQEFDETFAVGHAMRNDLEAVAKAYPKRRFTIVDAVVDQANVTSIAFRDQDGAFLAGALAALVSKKKSVGYLGGMDLPSLRDIETGFIAGAREIDPSTHVAIAYVGSLDNIPSAKKLAGAAYDAGADVLYVAAGNSGMGAIEELRRRPQAYAIGNDVNQDALAPGKILSSVVRRVDRATFKVVEEAQSLKATSGTLEFGLENDDIGMTDFKYTRGVVGSARARLAAIRSAIIDRRIVPPKSRAELAAFRPVKL